MGVWGYGRKYHVVCLIIFSLFVNACAGPTSPLPRTSAPPLPYTRTPTLTYAHTPTLSHTRTPTPTSTLTPTPDPLSPYFVESLRARSYGEGAIEIVETLEIASSFTRYLIAYPSDGLRITGMMNVPVGEGPFPVVILNHGYYDPAVYTTGRGTQNAADNFARHGLLTLAPDYRNYAGSDSGDNYFRTGYVVDVLNLIASVSSLPQARADSIGLWGHSMGGGISLEVMVVNPVGLRGVILYGAMSGDMTDNYTRIAYFRGQPTPGIDWPVAPEDAPDAYIKLSPINYLDYVSVPVLIHHGDLDDQVPPEWSARLADALAAGGKDVTLYAYPGAGHSFYNEDWNLFMRRNVEFFDRLLKSQ